MAVSTVHASVGVTTIAPKRPKSAIHMCVIHFGLLILYVSVDFVGESLVFVVITVFNVQDK